MKDVELIEDLLRQNRIHENCITYHENQILRNQVAIDQIEQATERNLPEMKVPDKPKASTMTGVVREFLAGVNGREFTRQEVREYARMEYPHLHKQITNSLSQAVQNLVMNGVLHRLGDKYQVIHKEKNPAL